MHRPFVCDKMFLGNFKEKINFRINPLEINHNKRLFFSFILQRDILLSFKHAIGYLKKFYVTCLLTTLKLNFTAIYFK